MFLHFSNAAVSIKKLPKQISSENIKNWEKHADNRSKAKIAYERAYKKFVDREIEERVRKFPKYFFNVLKGFVMDEDEEGYLTTFAAMLNWKPTPPTPIAVTQETPCASRSVATQTPFPFDGE